MNRDWFGDSYDIVKRFFVGVIRSLDYVVYVDPMPTGNWMDSEASFLAFIGAQHVRDAGTSNRSALLLDPDTGIGDRVSPRHTTIEQIVFHLEHHALVIAFAQSFSRAANPLTQLQAKLRQLHAHGAYGFYYDSHARFLFSSRSQQHLNELQQAFLKTGLPESRIVVADT